MINVYKNDLISFKSVSDLKKFISMYPNFKAELESYLDINLVRNAKYAYELKNMRKKDILERLESFSLDKDKYIIVGGASLVLNGVKRDCSNIDICCSVDTFNSIKDNSLLEKSIFNTDIKKEPT